MGPLLLQYEFLGKVRDVYAERMNDLLSPSESSMATENHIDEVRKLISQATELSEKNEYAGPLPPVRT